MEKIAVGYVRNTQGLNGELKLEILTDFPERFEENITYFLGTEEIPVNIESYRIHKDNVIIKFREFSFIDEVEDFKGQYLTINKEDRFPLEEDQYYIEDLKGFNIIGDGESLGILVDINMDHAQPIIIGRTEQNKEFSFPGVEAFVESVNIEKEEIHIHPIEGMLDED